MSLKEKIYEFLRRYYQNLEFQTLGKIMTTNDVNIDQIISDPFSFGLDWSGKEMLTMKLNN